MTTNIDNTNIATSFVSREVMDSVSSMFAEMCALLLFFVTWTVLSYMKKKKAEPTGKGDVKPARFVRPKKSADETAQVVISLCQSQFTRALRMYREMVKNDQDKEVVSEEFYTALVEAAVRVGQHDVAEQVTTRMHENGMVPSAQFVQSLLKLLAARKLFKECVDAWRLFQPEPDQVVYSCLTLASAETGDIEQTREFLALTHKSFPVASRDYIPLIRAYARKKDYRSAIADLRALMEKKVYVESVVFNSTLAVCSHGLGLESMRGLITEMRTYQEGFEEKTVDIVTYNTLMKALGRGHDLNTCFSLLEEIHAANLEPDDVTFSTLLDACMEEDHHELASLCLDRMCQSGVKMNCVLLTTLMKGFIRSRRLDKAMSLFQSMRTANSQVKPDMITYSMLIRAQCDAHDMGRALEILEDMLQNHCEVDDVVFTHLIEGCCHVNNSSLADKLFCDMIAAEIKPSIYTLTGMVKVYGKCGQSQKAEELVRTMQTRFGIPPTVVIHTCLISGLIRQKKYTDALAAYRGMSESGVMPDAQGIQTMIQGLSDAAMWKPLLDIVEEALNRRPPVHNLHHECLNNALSQMLGRGEIAKARQLYKIMVEKHVEITVQAIRRRLNVESRHVASIFK